MRGVTYYFNPFSITTNTWDYHSFSTEDAPIFVRGDTVTLNPKKMIAGYPYKFEYQGETLIAKKDKIRKGLICIYEVLDEKT